MDRFSSVQANRTHTAFNDAGHETFEKFTFVQMADPQLGCVVGFFVFVVVTCVV